MKNKVINKNLGTNNVITCDNITISFGKKNPVILLNNFNYHFTKGKIYAIVGKSGVGKTTLVSHFNGLLRTKQGNIFVKDKAILGKQRKIRNYKEIRKDVSLVFQFPETQIFKDKVIKDIAYGPINYNVDKEKAYKLASKYCYLVGLDKQLLNRNPFELSNGQKRLVAIAGVLAIESDVIVLDEPTAGLDPYYQDKIVKLIRLLNKQGKTIILITHNMNNVLSLADEVLVLHKNKLHRFGQPYQIFRNQKLMGEVGLDKPNIIKVIEKAVAVNKHYSYLWKAQPKDLDQLAMLIKKGGRNV